MFGEVRKEWKEVEEEEGLKEGWVMFGETEGRKEVEEGREDEGMKEGWVMFGGTEGRKEGERKEIRRGGDASCFGEMFKEGKEGRKIKGSKEKEKRNH